MKKGVVFIGTSGYMYDHWRNVFYPSEVKKKEWLEYYAAVLTTVELNVSFYRLPSEKAFQGWYTRTPCHFTFAVKGNRYITHVKRLKEVEDSLELFLSRVSLLKEKAGVILWQFPPNFAVNSERLESFLFLFKRNVSLRHVFEFRHESWFESDIEEMLKKNNCAYCCADWPDFCKNIPVTADFFYLRRHGAGTQLYGGSYSEDLLRQDALLIKDITGKGHDVYCYFNNDMEGFAALNAQSLVRMLEELE